MGNGDGSALPPGHPPMPHGHPPIAKGVSMEECPVPKDSRNNISALMGAMGGKGGNGAPGACPVVHTGSDAAKKDSPRFKGPVYNVYSQEIDPKNMMPAANQAMAPGQAVPLSTERVQSNIPKGGTEGSWLYPSPQMFYNSLVRKGKAEGVAETEVDMVVAIHNEMNERTWRELTKWEDMHKSEQLEGEPALRRFMGKPYELSPKAKLKSYLGFGFPFDRHDWFVDRGGRTVRYVIDYYFNPNGSAVAPPPATAPAAPAPGAVKPGASLPADAVAGAAQALPPRYTTSIHVDVRPAVDDVGAVMDRLMRFPERLWESFSRPKFRAEGIDPRQAPKPEDGGAAAATAVHTSDAYIGSSGAAAPASASTGAGRGAVEEDPLWAQLDAQCAPLLEKVKNAGSEEERRSASMALNYRMGRLLCPVEAAAFMQVLERNAAVGADGEAGGAEEAAFDAMTRCVVQQVRTRRAPTGGPAAASQPRMQ